MKDRLIELIEESYYCSIEEMADHLIASGVTFDKDANVPSKWIPVTESLPENGTAVLVFTVDRQVTISRCVELRVDRYQDITHWLPLPDQPKGE